MQPKLDAVVSGASAPRRAGAPLLSPQLVSSVVRGLRSGSGAALLVILLRITPTPAVAQYSVHTLHESGPKEERFTFLLVSEGYTQQELPTFLDDAHRVMGDFLATSPFDAYKSYFNVQAVAVASNESGMDDLDRGIVRDTYFHVEKGGTAGPHVRFGPEGAARFEAIRAELGMEWWNSIVMTLVNDDTPSGTPFITSGKPDFQAAVHEIGHQFAHLKDEYDTGQPESEGFNLTRETRREHVRWRHWFEADTPIPTPPEPALFDRVGLWEGGGALEGVYRPQFICKMQHPEDPFCAVCREHLVKDLNGGYMMQAMRVVSPTEATLSVTESEQVHFSLRTPQPEHGLKIQWLVNGIEVGRDSETLTLDGSALGRGEHRVELVISDETPMVRDPELIQYHLTRRRDWTLNLGATTANDDLGGVGALSLAPNFPNPVRAATAFTLHLPTASPANLKVLDLLGREIATVAEGFFPAGQHRAEWRPDGVAPGVYLYSLEAGGQRITRRLVVTR